MQTNSTFRTILSFFAIVMLSNTVAARILGLDTLGCRGASKNKKGVDISFYSHKYGSDLSLQEDFFSESYATTKVHSIPSYLGSLDIIHSAQSSGKPEMGEIYDYETTFTNFTTLLTGYYFAEESGYHIFWYNGVVGGASLRVGAGAESCTGFIDKDITDDFTLKIIRATDRTKQEHFITYLEEGVAYPIEMIVNNWEGDVNFAPSVQVPSGHNYSFEGSMFSSIKPTSRE